MKSPPFAYARPATLEEAVEVLARTEGEGKVLAGGQSLVPILAMRLARPSTLVDLNATTGLDVLAADGDWVHIGAMVRQRRLEHAGEASVGAPLLTMALPWVGHRELRSRGTVCGSLAHADPAAELPAVACCLGATLEVTGPAGTRTVPAAEFFRGAMTTAVGPDEILSAVRFPVARPGAGFGFAEVARRHGDFALAGVATAVRPSGAGLHAVISAFGVSDRPVTADVSEIVAQVTADGDLDDPGLPAALVDPVRDVTDPMVDTAGDTHGSPAYRRRLLAHLAAGELVRAHRRASLPDRGAS